MYSAKQENERQTFNRLVHKKWDGKSLLVNQTAPPFADYSGDLFEGALRAMGSLAGKSILENGCGSGEISVWLALHGAEVSGIDISEDSILIANERARQNGVTERAHFLACSGEATPFPPEQFDIIFINVSLHHLDVDLALQEFLRILKPRGVLVAVEPIVFSNRVQKIRESALFQKFYPIRQESTSERILNLVDQKKITQQFSVTRFEPYRIISLFVFKAKPIYSWLSRHLYAKEPDPRRQEQLCLRAVQRMDERLLKLCPWLKIFARYAVIRAGK